MTVERGSMKRPTPNASQKGMCFVAWKSEAWQTQYMMYHSLRLIYISTLLTQYQAPNFVRMLNYDNMSVSETISHAKLGSQVQYIPTG
jgi:hypothetical protein